MRLISQDGRFDVPYEKVQVSVNGNDIYATTIGLQARRRMGEYNSNGEAITVMDAMLAHYVGRQRVFRFPSKEDITE